MIYLALQLGQRDWGDLIQSALHGTHSNDAYAVMHLPPAQADMLDRAMHAPLVVIHEKGVPRFTQAALAAIARNSKIVEQQRNYTIYRVTNPGASK